MDWQQLDVPTRVGFVATVMAVIGLIVPPIGVASAIVAIVFSGVGWRRARERGQTNPIALRCLIGSAALIVLVVVGNAIYSAAN